MLAIQTSYLRRNDAGQEDEHLATGMTQELPRELPREIAQTDKAQKVAQRKKTRETAIPLQVNHTLAQMDMVPAPVAEKTSQRQTNQVARGHRRT